MPPASMPGCRTAISYARRQRASSRVSHARCAGMSSDSFDTRRSYHAEIMRLRPEDRLPDVRRPEDRAAPRTIDVERARVPGAQELALGLRRRDARVRGVAGRRQLADL